MSSIPEPSPDSAEVRARDEAATSSLVTMFTGARDAKAALEAVEIRTLAAAAALVDEQRSRLGSRASLKTDLPARSMVAELATAARASERTVQRLLDQSADLCARFAPVVDALGEGRISRSHVSVIHDAGHPIDDESARAQYVEAAIARAENTTPGQLRPVVEILAARLNPRTIQDRHRDAREKRGVQVRETGDGMADLTATLPAVLAHGIYDRLTQHAHAVIAARPTDPDTSADTSADTGAWPVAGASTSTDPGADADAPDAADDTRDNRTMDQLRVDILCDLLLTGTAETCTTGEGIDAIRATVQITIPVLTAAGADTEPALLAGYGPIDPATAQRLAGNTPAWIRVMTDPADGNVLAVDRYRPTTGMDRYLQARDERCRFPGCRQPVWRCDLDHTIDAAHGGATACCNLAHLCKRHHVLKHNTAWTVRQLPRGILEWTSPTGRVYIDLPEPVVRFVPAPSRFDFRDPTTWSEITHDGDPPPF